MTEVSRDVLRSIVRDDMRIEAKAANILQGNVMAARNELLAQLKENPDDFQARRLSTTLDAYYSNRERESAKDFPTASIYKHGIDEGRMIMGEGAGFPRDSAYWSWAPMIPSNAISLADSEMVSMIKRANDETKEKILRQSQIGLALGESRQDTIDRIFGTGISGLKGRDGVFRSASVRAETIARTVTNDLINRGAMLTYEQVDSLCPELNIRKVWQTLSDNRTSPVCMELAGQIKKLDDLFVAGSYSGQNPPAHPNCRSRVTTLSERYTKELEGRFNSPPVSKPLPKPPDISDNLPVTSGRIYKPSPLPRDTIAAGETRFNVADLQDAIHSLPPEQAELISTLMAKNNIQVTFPSRGLVGVNKNTPEAQNFVNELKANARLSVPPNFPRNIGEMGLPNLNANAHTNMFTNLVNVYADPATVGSFKPDIQRMQQVTSGMVKYNRDTGNMFSSFSSKFPVGSDEQIHASLLHELGHQVHWRSGYTPRPPGSQSFTMLMDGMTGDKNASSAKLTALRNGEWHAEATRLWATNPEIFKQYDEIGFNHIQEMIKRAAMRPDMSLINFKLP